MVYFDSSAIYISSAKTNTDKVKRIDAIIIALEDAALQAAANNGITEYTLDDGQTTIKQGYRSTIEVLNSIIGFERLRQMYLNRLNGRMVRLVDSKSFRYGRNDF